MICCYSYLGADRECIGYLISSRLHFEMADFEVYVSARYGLIKKTDNPVWK